jgi:tryptophan synthase alpha chain
MPPSLAAGCVAFVLKRCEVLDISLAKIAEATSGFVYLVSVTGVTGARTDVATRVTELVKSLKSVTDKPIAVGFGVSKGEHARSIIEMGGDGVICGSALVRALGEAGSPEEGLEAMTSLFRELRAATK